MRKEIIIVGAGPYGLAAGAHLTGAGVEAQVFGQPMSFWRVRMPKGMLLRSAWYACNISDPRAEGSLSRYQAAQQKTIEAPVPLDDFVQYGQWFQSRLLPDADNRIVTKIERTNDRFRVELEDGESIACARVVIAAGIARFAYKPQVFAPLLEAGLSSHLSEHSDLSKFSGRSIIVVGGGQSALESAALLHEAGAEVELLARARKLRFLSSDARSDKSLSAWQRLKRSDTDVGPPWLTHLVSHPRALRCAPRRFFERLAYRAIRPAGAGWLRPRLRDVRVTCGRNIVAAERRDGRAALMLDDATPRYADHVLLATGYRVNVKQYPFLPAELIERLRIADGYPVLNSGFESSIPGLHFVGAPAARDFGPLARFVSGTRYSASALARWIVSQGALEQPAREIWIDHPADAADQLAANRFVSR